MTDRERNPDRGVRRAQRLAMLTAAGGSLSMVAMPAIPSTPRAFDGIPGTWSCPDAADGVSVTATTDVDLQVDGRRLDGTAVLGPESRLRFSGTVTAQVAREVDGTWFLQVSDSNSANLAAFRDLEFYDYDPGWAVDAHYRPRAEANRPMTSGRHGNDTEHVRSSPGDVDFTVDGRQHRLAVYATFMPDLVTVNFTDETSGVQTPSAGRILALPNVSGGPLVLDFNYAMLLPYEASSVYPCPVPPADNHLPVAVTAGERTMRFDR